MKKKVFITVPTLTAGGMERSAVNFAKFFDDNNYEVTIYTVSGSDIFFNIPDTIRIINGKKKIEDKWLTFYSLYKLRILAKKNKPDFVLSFSGKMSVYIIISLLGLDIPVIPFHRSNPNRIYGAFNNFLNKLFYPYCKALVVQTDTAKNIFKKKFNNENIIVVNNPIRKLNIDKNIKKEKIVICVSRLVEGKGIDKLIKYFSEIDPPEWKLYILGDGMIKKDLENYSKSLNMDQKVKFLGFRKDVDYFLSKSSIFAFTSETEGFPNSLLEAMCFGLACISYDCPTGPSDIISNNENGFLIDMNNENEYIKKLKILIENKDLRNKFSREAVKLNDFHKPNFILGSFLKKLENNILENK